MSEWFAKFCEIKLNHNLVPQGSRHPALTTLEVESLPAHALAIDGNENKLRAYRTTVFLNIGTWAF
jgi:hypothetical protein